MSGWSWTLRQTFSVSLLRNANTGPLKCVIAVFSVTARIVCVHKCMQTYLRFTQHPPTRTHAHTTSHRPTALSNIRDCGSSSPPNEHHDMSLCFSAPSLLSLWSLTWRNSTIASFFSLIHQKQNNCYLFLSSFFGVVAAEDHRVQTMAYSEQVVWVYLLVGDLHDVVGTKEKFQCCSSGDWTHLGDLSQRLLL